MCQCLCNCFMLILCLIFPPLAVLIRDGCTINVCINILFTCLGLIPGMIHAIYICFYYSPPGSVYIQGRH